MKVRLLAVGTRMPAWVEAGVEEYRKRLPREMPVEIVEIAPGARGKNADIARAIQSEGDRMLEKLRDQEHVVALEVKGSAWTTEQLSQRLDDWRQGGQDVALLIGGPDGLDPRLSARARQSWSLSALTLPHPLVRVLLAEQLYRAWTLLAGHPYHR
ncbi:23S rRNA (pseudouridine(1915)-N(3))-methyltransferase RlmH [Salinicola endophyticus]|uniref:Ribosomal RNA large subunit methyltransferase H n=1 Tax=Salinicola endophyticus TaxID=1949083 RepID=A0ABY8FK07_9GAMM|nr:MULTISPECIES: 23S rRNA (pseudouridine(1915)-N(3))-methyltransferase RlmH [Salinicola]WFF43142.1 23S rRNA (pseudouridine(1915)-N(3))-methyltransferase RlmH [Salinicola endophyticus]